MIIFLKVALGGKSSDYTIKIYGTRREAEKTKKFTLGTKKIHSSSNICYQLPEAAHVQ
mgnify:CR=1 FL=1